MLSVFFTLTYFSLLAIVKGDATSFWKDYQGLRKHKQFLLNLQTRHSNSLKVESIGRSIEGRDLLLAKVCLNRRCGRRPIIWVDSAVHAREWIGPAATTYLLKNLLENGRYRKMLRAFDWFILPIANPDGYSYSKQVNPEWRKNRRRGVKCLARGDPAEGPGVDLNRNFGFAWKGSDDKCSSNYPGSKPFSEPETRAIRDFLLPRYKGQVVIYNSVHSAGQAFVIPWGHTNKKWKGERLLKRFLEAGREAMGNAGKPYRIGTVKQVYGVNANGGVNGWAAAKLGTMFPFVTELVDKKRWGRTPPKEQIFSEVEAFLDFAIGSAEAAFNVLMRKSRRRRDGGRYQGSKVEARRRPHKGFEAQRWHRRL